MINKLKKIYPKYKIYIKRNRKYYDLKNKEVTKEIILNTNSVIIYKESYMVHKKSV